MFCISSSLFPSNKKNTTKLLQKNKKIQKQRTGFCCLPLVEPNLKGFIRLWKKLLDLLIALYGSPKTSPWNETSKISEKYEFDESGKVFELKKIENFGEGVL